MTTPSLGSMGTSARASTRPPDFQAKKDAHFAAIKAANKAGTRLPGITQPQVGDKPTAATSGQVLGNGTPLNAKSPTVLTPGAVDGYAESLAGNSTTWRPPTTDERLQGIANRTPEETEQLRQQNAIDWATPKETLQQSLADESQMQALAANQTAMNQNTGNRFAPPLNAIAAPAPAVSGQAAPQVFAAGISQPPTPVQSPARQALNARLAQSPAPTRQPSLSQLGAPPTRPAVDGTQIGSGAPPITPVAQQQSQLNINGGAPQQIQGALPAPSAGTTSTTGGGTTTTQNIQLPQFRPLNTAPIKAGIEADAARRQASMDKRTSEAFAGGGAQFSGPAQQAALNLNQARAFSGVEPALAQLGVSETEMFNKYSPAFGNMQLGLAGLNSQNQNSLLGLIPQLLNAMSGYV
jgi:hypothetical protein